MMRKLKLFASDRKGNVAIITATSLSVMVMLGAGATDIARVNKVRSSMQTSADATLLTALRLKKPRWGKRVKFASQFFKENFSHPNMVSHLKSRLSGRQNKDGMIFKFKTSAKITKLLPNGLSLVNETIEVSSMAEISKSTNYEPRLILDRKASSVSHSSSSF